MIGNLKVHNWKKYVQFFIIRMVSQSADNIRTEYDCIVPLPDGSHNDDHWYSLQKAG